MEDPKLKVLRVEDPMALPQARKAHRHLALELPTPKGTLVAFHENPRSSHLPRVGELRIAVRKAKAEVFEPRGGPPAAEESSEPGQCQGKTKKGSQCKKNALEGSDYCATHQE